MQFSNKSYNEYSFDSLLLGYSWIPQVMGYGSMCCSQVYLFMMKAEVLQIIFFDGIVLLDIN